MRLEEFASAVEDRFNNPFVNHELMSISLNSTSKWKARNMPSFLAYIDEQKKLPKCLTMCLAAYIAFYSNDIQERTADGLICKPPTATHYNSRSHEVGLVRYLTLLRPTRKRRYVRPTVRPTGRRFAVRTVVRTVTDPKPNRTRR